MAHYRRIKKIVSKNRRVEKAYWIEALEKGRISVIDDSNFEPGMCNNGGHYRFIEEWEKLENGKWEVQHWTSAEFAYCHGCGTFGDHRQWDEEDNEYYLICGPPRQISQGALIEYLKDVDRNTDECRYDAGQKANYWR
jgi:hypothetical protein